VGSGGHLAIRGNGPRAWAGWPTSERIESLRTAWFSAPDEAARKAICRDMQLQVWQDVPYIPGGRWRHPTVYRKRVSGVPRGTPLFHNVRVA
jgi:peptide/nickel transport system substrate-binding protein